MRDEGYGFLRVRATCPPGGDVYISAKMVRQNAAFTKGDHVSPATTVRPA
ncbi:MAG: hypothetical protein IPF42_09535, partial [Candidatus Microthrix sp.]|nr:hypothetical protein [Candidatus Microthrix sp.]